MLVYNKMPCFYSSSGPKDGKGKRRELVLCIDSFLRLRGMPSPQCWLAELRWIVQLLDVYLDLGRDGSTGSGNSLNQNTVKRKPLVWTPDGWLDSSIEFISLSFLLDKNEDLFKAIDFDLNSEQRSVDKKECKDLLAMFLNGKNAVELNGTVSSFLRFASGLSFGAGLSTSVLKHAHVTL